MLGKFLDPKNDVAFKRIFGSEKNKDILIHFLNDMLAFKGREPIVDVTFLKTSLDPEIAVLKTSIVDVMCRDQLGNQYIVEMQVAKEKGFEKRAQYYAAKVYCSQIKKGSHYGDLKEVIFLAITDFVMLVDKKEFKSDHVILDVKTHENDLKDFSFTFLELPKFNKTMDELTTIIDRWAYFFKHAPQVQPKDEDKIIGNEKIIEKVYDQLERFNWTEQDLLSYDQAEKYESAYQASMEQKFDEGMAKGKAEGIIEAKREMATGMLKQKIDIKTVALLTGLSISELKKLSWKQYIIIAQALSLNF